MPKKQRTPAQAYRLGEITSKQLSELAAVMHDGNETATLRELIRREHEQRFPNHEKKTK